MIKNCRVFDKITFSVYSAFITVDKKQSSEDMFFLDFPIINLIFHASFNIVCWFLSVAIYQMKEKLCYRSVIIYLVGI